MGFFPGWEQTAVMRAGSGSRTIQRRTSRATLWLGSVIVLFPLPLLADTFGPLRATPSAACYCRCAMSRAHGGCAKMCESKRYASRWWATTCSKPRSRKPAGENPGASPRLPHPDRAEHAQLTP